VSGVIVSPEPVADSPTTLTMKSGRKTMAAKKLALTVKTAAFPQANTGLRNRRGSSSGSGARRSTSTKATVPSADSANSPRIGHDAHG
jgi:hypothetical protein